MSQLSQNRRNIIALSIVATLLCGSWLLHKFYVSLSEIRFNSESERLEVSIRIFPDDLDRALQSIFGISAHLATDMEHKEADSLLQIYLDFHIAIKVNGEPVILKYLGKEPEADAIWCYMESEPIIAPSSILIRSSLLTDEFEDQVNIIQVYNGKWNKGMMLTREHTSDQLIIGQ